MQEKQEHLREQLIRMRRDILHDLKGKDQEAAQLVEGGAPDIGDQSVRDYLQDYLHLLGNRQRDRLAMINDALNRMDADTYGLCERCGEKIGIKRLEAQPHARYCIKCQELLEQEGELESSPPRGAM